MEKYFSDDFIQKIVEKISTEVVSCIIEQIKSAINEKQQRSVRTIEARAKEYTKREYSQYKTSVQTVSRIAYIAGATEQKAIDEEVRLKKCDDMTEAEYNREVAFADWYNKNGKGIPTYSDAIEWARKETIIKVFEWLKARNVLTEVSIEGFKKSNGGTVMTKYNEDYLNALIAKAKKSWEGVDVDSFMSDLRDDLSDKEVAEKEQEALENFRKAMEE